MARGTILDKDVDGEMKMLRHMRESLAWLAERYAGDTFMVDKIAEASERLDAVHGYLEARQPERIRLGER